MEWTQPRSHSEDEAFLIDEEENVEPVTLPPLNKDTPTCNDLEEFLYIE